MSLNIALDSLEEIYRQLMRWLDRYSDHQSAPRGKPIKEFLAATFTLTDPRNRLILSPARNVNYGFAVGELCWYVRGDTDLETMLYYNRRMGQFSDDGKTINSAYGHRMFRTRFVGDRFTGMGDEIDDRSQIDNVIRELRRDPDSRRAVMHINEPADLNKAAWSGSKDVPCTMSIQLLIRNRLLHMHVLMRSNDVVWGVPYDVFSFTCLQESFLYMLQAAGVPVDDLGHYHHTAGSLHIYDTHYAMAGEVAKETGGSPPPMSPFTLDEIEILAHRIEPNIRTDGSSTWTVPSEDSAIGWMSHRLLEHRQKRLAEAEERARKSATLDELTRLTEDVGGYEDGKSS